MVNQRLETVLVAMKNGKIKITAKAKDKNTSTAMCFPEGMHNYL